MRVSTLTKEEQYNDKKSRKEMIHRTPEEQTEEIVGILKKMTSEFNSFVSSLQKRNVRVVIKQKSFEDEGQIEVLFFERTHSFS